MHLIGQRWRYQIGNTRVDVDNAFSWTMWGQERLRANDELLGQSGGRMRLFQSWAAPWLTPIGEGMLSVKLRSAANGIACNVALDGDPIEPEALFGARWRGPARSWPEEATWERSPRPPWIALPKRSG